MSSMLCQNCKTPLKLDSSLEDLSPAAFHQLIGSVSHSPEQNAKPFSPFLFSRDRKDLFDVASSSAMRPIYSQVHVPASPLSEEHQDSPLNTTKEHPDMSFVMLTDSQVIKSPKITSHEMNKDIVNAESPTSRNHQPIPSDENVVSQKMETSSKLFELLSSRSDIDYPICTECTAVLVEKMEKKLESLVREKDVFLEFIKSTNADAPTDEEIRRVEDELGQVKLQEKAAREELETLEAEKTSLELQLMQLEEEVRQLDEDKKLFWSARNTILRRVSALRDEKESINTRYNQDSRQLERLQRTNVYNDTFCISHDGGFATINGLRLGRTNPPTVDWPEINAAWGYACLLLVTVSEKLGYTFKDYRLVPMGSTSGIEKLSSGKRPSAHDILGSEKSSSLPLYHSGDLPLNLGFLTRNFNNGMVAFLQCLYELGLHVEKTTKGNPNVGNGVGLKLPYEIDKDKIHDCSIKIASFSGGEESWTKACKYTLTCCKFLLAHVSNTQASDAKSR